MTLSDVLHYLGMGAASFGLGWSVIETWRELLP